MAVGDWVIIALLVIASVVTWLKGVWGLSVIYLLSVYFFFPGNLWCCRLSMLCRCVTSHQIPVSHCSLFPSLSPLFTHLYTLSLSSLLFLISASLASSVSLQCPLAFSPTMPCFLLCLFWWDPQPAWSTHSRHCGFFAVQADWLIWKAALSHHAAPCWFYKNSMRMSYSAVTKNECFWTKCSCFLELKTGLMAWFGMIDLKRSHKFRLPLVLPNYCCSNVMNYSHWVSWAPKLLIVS